MKVPDLIYILTRCVIGAIFIYAGIVKLAEPKVFAVLLDAYGILPEVMIMPAALGLPLLEIVAGTGLIFNIRGSLTTITSLLILFIVVLGYGISMGLDIDCGCFGPDDPEQEAYHGLRSTLYRDIILLAACIYLHVWHKAKAIIPLPITYYLKKSF